MNATVLGVVIRAEGTMTVGPVSTNLADLQQLVAGGGYVEAVNFAGGAHAYVDESGKLHGKPVNDLATMVAERLRPGFSAFDCITGDVVFLGSTPDGDEADCPRAVINLILGLADPRPCTYPQTRPAGELASDLDDDRRDARRDAMRDGL